MIKSMSDEILKKIKNDFLDGKYLDVVTSADEALKFDENNVDLLNLKGISLINLNDFENAKETLILGVSKDEYKEGIRQNLAKLYLNLKDYNNAASIFIELNKINPKNKQYIELLSECFLNQDNYAQAMYWCNQYLDIFDDKNTSIKNMLAVSLTGNGDYDKSIKLLNDLIETDPANYYALNNQGNNYRYLENYQLAMDFYNQAINLSDDFYDPYNNLGTINQTLEKYEEAELNYRKCLDGDEDNNEANYNLANLLELLGREEESLQFFAKGGYRGRIKLPEVLFNINRLEDFNQYISSIKERISQDRRISAIANFATEQLDIENPYPWCPDPFSYMSVKNIQIQLDKNNLNYDQLLIETDDLNEEFEPKDMTTLNGYQTTGNLFNLAGVNVNILKDTISTEIENYKDKFKENVPYIKNWPKNYFINGWRVRLKSEGKQDFHIHARAWCSGVFYIKIPEDINNDEGAIEFGLYGFNYKMIKNSTKTILHNPTKGDLVLFPSSLFHRTIPFVSNDERICIAFDIIPKS
tara:strand:- start:2111 stop:3691 length:1581 start_codon:yes stop_codon:yes gene_type:complete